MKQEIICHIGFPKTGTTFLQTTIFPNIEGVNYIKSNILKDILHDLIEKDDSFYDEDKVHAELAKRHIANSRMLFSYEPLTGHHLKTEFANRSQIARRLKSANVSKVIITIRNQTDILESTYKQYIKSGGVLKISEFFDFNGNPNPWFYINYFNYERIIDVYSNIFGRDNVKVLQYENLFLNGNSMKNELEGGFEIERMKFKGVSELKVNKSLSNFSIKLLRIINHLTFNNYRPSSLINKKLSTQFFYKILKRINIPTNEKKLISKYENDICTYFSKSNSLLEEKNNIILHEKYCTIL